MRSYRNQPIGTVPRARQLRREAPEPERRLLRGLREAFPHLKWRHQTPLGPFHPDILCFSEKLVIEVDGDTHAHTVSEDAARTRFIERQGYRVLRFTNTDVMQNLEGVLTQISFSLREKEGARRVSGGKDEGDHAQKKDSPA
ncbi:endonuclease domain-containing protein [uncultured Sphingomonas sp.]|uniref:endonuclease domain-containing protein n=1 Tax=uncultured Sphingomonas sp. TaxID=158754 RepID=UPI0035CAB815